MKRPIYALAAPAIVALAAPDALALPAVRAYGISDFGGTNECGQTSMTHSVHAVTAASFLGPFAARRSIGAWGQVAHVSSQSSDVRRFDDGSKVSFGADASSFGVDTGTVGYVHTHGFHSAAANDAGIVMGNNIDDCSATTDDFLFGNAGGGLEILIVKACQAADFDVWRKGGFSNIVKSDSIFSLYNGFHGDSSCGMPVAYYVQDYAANSFWTGVGENWIDEAFDDQGAGADDCPTSIIYGDTYASRVDMFRNGGFKNRLQTHANKSHSSYGFVAGCSPADGSVLPDL